ncbi:MAG: hypothetical protein QOE04_648 [Mycobacterium sp.]|jgi:hypothetical protein|nr:hypothetical protein [Mycobacterium sp.]
MKTPIRYLAPLFAAAAISGTIALAPAAAAAPSTNRASSTASLRTGSQSARAGRHGSRSVRVHPTRL